MSDANEDVKRGSCSSSVGLRVRVFSCQEICF